MSTLIQPIALLAIILTGYLFKRAGKFKNRDYRIMQVALFNLVLPCAIIYSFATNPHDSSMLWISVFGFRRFSAPRRSCQRPCSTSATA